MSNAGIGLGQVLREAAGESAVHAISPPVQIAGASLEWQVEPTGVDELAAALRVLDEADCPALVRGGGSRIEAGPACPGARVLLSTRGLCGVLQSLPDEGVIEVAAGTKLLDVVDHLEGSIWELPLDAPGEDATVGGTLASAVQGPRRIGFGPVRYQVLGLEIVLADGTRTRCGGRVVKNVTGYDLAKLHVGADGAFGVIASAWLRLRPRPEATRTLTVSFDERQAAVTAAREAGRMPSARMATLLSGDLAGRVSGLVSRGASWVLAVELAGSEALCARDAEDLLRRPRASERAFSIDGVGAVLTQAGGHSLQARLTLLPSELEAALEVLAAAGLSAMAQPEAGLLEVAIDSDRPEDIDAASRVLKTLAEQVSGRVVLSVGGVGHGRSVETMGAHPGERALLVALKQRFDPNSILNPGRLGEDL